MIIPCRYDVDKGDASLRIKIKILTQIKKMTMHFANVGRKALR